MKQQSISLAVLLLVSSSKATETPDGSPIYPLEYHFNEDPHSVPDPIAGKKYMTTTQAKYYKKETWDTDTENASINPGFHQDFNWHAAEPKQAVEMNNWTLKYWGKDANYLQMNDSDESDSDSDSESSGSDSDSDEEENKDKKEEIKKEDAKPEEKKPEEKKPEEKKPEDKVHIMWKQLPDLGELDDHATLYREFDMDYEKGGAKFSGWTNPLSWTDSGSDDDLVLMQMTADGLRQRRFSESSLLQYEEAEGPTKVDLGDQDMHVVNREADNAYLTGGAKFHGWTNPLGWTDDGEDDGKVI